MLHSIESILLLNKVCDLSRTPFLLLYVCFKSPPPVVLGERTGGGLLNAKKTPFLSLSGYKTFPSEIPSFQIP